MAFHISVRKGVLGALLLAAGCTSGSSDHGRVDLAGNGVDNGADNGSTSGSNGSNGSNGSSTTQFVSVTNLTSDQSGNATNLSASLINAWGMTAYQGMFWVANEGSGKVSIFDAGGKASTGKPASDSLDLGRGITAVTLNDSTAMQITSGGTCGPANLIFASSKGKLIGVNTDFSTTGGFVLVDRSAAGAVYTGVTMIHAPVAGNCSSGGGSGTSGGDNGNGHGDTSGGNDHGNTGGGSTGSGGSTGGNTGGGSTGSGGSTGGNTGGGSTGGGSTGGNTGGGSTGGGNTGGGACQAGPVLVLAADFFNARIDVFDESFHLVSSPMFQDADIPAGYAPFNVMAFRDVVYVTYAKQSGDKTEEVGGAGQGFVAAFDLSGKLMWTAKGNELNAPWGLALASPGSKVFSGALLVGNFGDGHITLIDPANGSIRGQLMTAENVPLAIEGLWAIAFGTGVQGTEADGLYFTAGPGDEQHGMFGVIAAATTTTTSPQ